MSLCWSWSWGGLLSRCGTLGWSFCRSGLGRSSWLSWGSLDWGGLSWGSSSFLFSLIRSFLLLEIFGEEFLISDMSLLRLEPSIFLGFLVDSLSSDSLLSDKSL